MDLTETQTQQYMFPHFDVVEPENLYGFHHEYLDQLPALKAFIKMNVGRTMIDVCIKRLQNDGVTKKKFFHGLIEDYSEIGFHFMTNETWGGFYEQPQKIFFRYDNVLGDVPVLFPDTKIYYFPNEAKIAEYMKWLEEIRIELSKITETSHYVKLYYKYSVDKKLFRNGNFHVIGKIQKVNKSNLEYFHHKTMAFLSKEKAQISLEPCFKIDKFISPDHFLFKVEVCPIDYKINIHDIE